MLIGPGLCPNQREVVMTQKSMAIMPLTLEGYSCLLIDEEQKWQKYSPSLLHPYFWRWTSLC